MIKIGIARNLPDDCLLPAFEAALTGGFTHLEITMNSAHAQAQIATCVKAFGDRVLIGAGTVRNPSELERALKAGARFIVTPNICAQVIHTCNQEGIPVFPGALTPTEVWQAWELGANLVKVFPVGALGGASYIQDLKGPFDQVPLLAFGGVTLENWPLYLKAGISGVALGGSLFKPAWLEKKDWQSITTYAKGFE